MSYMNVLWNGMKTVFTYFGIGGGQAKGFKLEGDGVLNIPDDYQKSIEGNVFKNNKDIKELNTNKVTTIGNGAFEGCVGLRKVCLPEVTKLGDGAFAGCEALKSIDMPAIEKIGNKAFEATDIEKLEINNECRIEDEAFLSCTKLTEIKLSRNNIEIGENAFRGCINLKRIHVENLEQFEMIVRRFVDVEKSKRMKVLVCYEDITGDLIEIYLGRMLIKLNTMLSLYNPEDDMQEEEECNKKLSDELVTKTKLIDKGYFEKAKSIKKIVARNATDIAENAFEGFQNLEFMVLNEKVYIDKGAFKDCENLKGISPTNDGEISYFDQIVVKEDAFENSGIEAIKTNCMPIGISNKAFYNCKKLKEVRILKAEGRIGAQSFANCEALVDVSINTNGQNEDVEIDLSAFENCNNLDRNKIIGHFTYMIPAKVLEKDYVERYKEEIALKINDKGELRLLDAIEIGEGAFSEFEYRDRIGSMFVEKVEKVKAGAFEGVKSLVNVITNPDAIVEKCAFKNCESLEMFCGGITGACNLRNGVGESAFENTAINSLKVINNGRIEKKAFYNCENLEEVRIDADKVSIEEEAFANCKSLREIRIDVPDVGQLNIDKSAFNGCDNLRKLMMGYQEYGSVEEFFNAMGLND